MKVVLVHSLSAPSLMTSVLHGAQFALPFVSLDDAIRIHARQEGASVLEVNC